MAEDKLKSATSSRRLVWAGVAGVLGLFFVWAFWPSAVLVDLEEVTVGKMSVYVEGEGRTRVKDVYQISAPVTGRVLRIEAESGDMVIAKKTILAIIEPADPSFLDTRTRAEAEAAVQAAEDAQTQAEAALEQTRAQLKFSKRELERTRLLAAQGTVSKRALEKSELDWATRVAEVKSAEATFKVRAHELQTASARLIAPSDSHSGNGDCCIEIKSPIEGTVLRVLQESEGVVAVGTTLLEVGDPRDLEVVVDLLTIDAVSLKEGADVKIENWGGATLAGKVRRIAPYGYSKISVLGIEEQRIDVVIDFNEDQTVPRELGHGFRVETSILEWQGSNITIVPISAMFRSGGQWSVYLNDDGRAVQKIITVGHINKYVAEVIDGLTLGDMVVARPGDKVSDGARISARKR